MVSEHGLRGSAEQARRVAPALALSRLVREHENPGGNRRIKLVQGSGYNEAPMAQPAATVCLYQFKVVLRGVSPMIWRRILLRNDQTIADLHYAIQIAMGWSDSHLNCFHIHGKDYGVAHDGGISFDDNPEKVRLADLGFRLRQRFLYEYNFTDDSMSKPLVRPVRLEKV
jgi:Plasmid pRiA4b ORF-3-like protein